MIYGASLFVTYSEGRLVQVSHPYGKDGNFLFIFEVLWEWQRFSSAECCVFFSDLAGTWTELPSHRNQYQQKESRFTNWRKRTSLLVCALSRKTRQSVRRRDSIEINDGVALPAGHLHLPNECPTRVARCPKLLLVDMWHPCH